MRLKRKYVALIVVVMLIVTALLATMMVQYTEGGRIAYVGVRTDKSTYTDGENVTFKLVQLTSGLSFSTSGMFLDFIQYGGIDSSFHAVKIIRIPDGYDPEQVIGQKELDNILSWGKGDMGTDFRYFNNTDGPLSLSWNGTVLKRSYNMTTYHEEFTYLKATGGYYLIIPYFAKLAGHQVKFQLDRSAIFYLDSLRMTMIPNLDGSTLTLGAKVYAPANITDISHCRMYMSASGSIQPGVDSIQKNVTFDLGPGDVYEDSITAEVYPYMYQQYGLTGWIQTSWGNYSFDVSKWLINGRWTDGYMYAAY